MGRWVEKLFGGAGVEKEEREQGWEMGNEKESGGCRAGHIWTSAARPEALRRAFRAWEEREGSAYRRVLERMSERKLGLDVQYDERRHSCRDCHQLTLCHLSLCFLNYQVQCEKV